MDVTDADASVPAPVAETLPSRPSPSDWGLQELFQYECVICGSNEVELEAGTNDDNPVEERLMGLICLIQPSSVLGKLVWLIGL